MNRFVSPYRGEDLQQQTPSEIESRNLNKKITILGIGFLAALGIAGALEKSPWRDYIYSVVFPEDIETPQQEDVPAEQMPVSITEATILDKELTDE